MIVESFCTKTELAIGKLGDSLDAIRLLIPFCLPSMHTIYVHLAIAALTCSGFLIHDPKYANYAPMFLSCQNLSASQQTG